MRLLDVIAQSRNPFLVQPDASGARPMVLSGPSDFARQIADCPLRFVMADDLTRASAELAFAEGDRLADCLDLLRIPASLLWVEWNDAVHQQVIYQCGAVAQTDPCASGRRVGVLLQAADGGRSGIARTFWSVANAADACEAILSPLEIHIDLDKRFGCTPDITGMLSGQYAGFTDNRDPGVAELLTRVRFRFDAKWLNYYALAARKSATRDRVARESLAAVSCDIPLLLAFFLLLNAKGATRPVPIQRHQLNLKRSARHRSPLLDHGEVHACLSASSPIESTLSDGLRTRRPSRLHHVRGHLVRREDRVFWRVPHLRGSAAQGVVRSRTVCLSFAHSG